MRPRVCAAIIRNDHVLMVFHDHGDRSFWTLPGGGVEAGESLEEAVIREVKEEVNLDCTVERFLFEEAYEYGMSYCYLVHINATDNPELGSDPELKHERQVLQDMAWFPLEEKKHDMQVSKVLARLV